MNRYFCIIAALLVFSNVVTAQDPHFSQFYASPLYLNPAFAGSTDGTRAIMNFRDQWPAIPGAFVTYAFSVDHYIPHLSSGVGLLFFQDRAGSGHLRSTNIGFQYTYEFQIGKLFKLRPAVHYYLSTRDINFSDLVFNDQMSLSGIASASVEVPPMKKVSYTDFSSSILVYNAEYFFGFVIDHMTQPNQSLVDGISEIPRKYTFHGGRKFYLNGKTSDYNEESLTAAFNFRSQGKFDQLDLGVYWTKTPIVLGLWYRGIPIFKAYKKGYQNNDAIIIMAGYQWEAIKVGYSFDLTISRLIANTFGSHEISLIYEFNQDQKARKKKRKVIIPCPKF